MKFEITCSCGDVTTLDRAGLEYWAQNVGKLRHYPAEGEITLTVKVVVEEADFRAEGLIQ